MLKYVKLMFLDCNNNRFDCFRKINKHRFKSIRNKERRFYKTLAIFDKKKIIKLKRFLFYLEENRNNLFVYREKFIASI